ncbi:hypothetical protein HY029_01085 [Candidatus Gottesmanbacteria bacterium]|nr:hypothetical protein [Candidatus Gottesmanbacteria bacterium]
MKKNSGSILLIFLVAAAIAAVITISLWQWQKSKPETQNFGPNYTKQIPDTKPKKQTPSTEEMANWKIYTTKKFKFKYPKDWQVGLFEHFPDMYTLQPSKDYVPESQNNSIVISISGHCLNTQCLTIFNLEEMVNQINAKIVNQTIVDGMKTYKVSLTGGKTAYVFISGQDFFEISTNKYPTELDEILSTFEFLNQKSENLVSQECGVCGQQGIHNVNGTVCAPGLICKKGLTTSLSYCVKQDASTENCEKSQ